MREMSWPLETDYVDAEDGALIVRFADHGPRLAPALFLMGLFAAGAWATLELETVRDFFYRLEPDGDIRIFTGIFLLLLALVLVDLILLVISINRERPALIIDTRGVRGLTGGLWRDYDWDKIAYIYVKYGRFNIIRKSRFPLIRFFQKISKTPGNNSRYDTGIHLPLAAIDRSEEELWSAIEHVRPEFAVHAGKTESLWSDR